MFDPVNVVFCLLIAGAVYGGIRQDLKNMHTEIKRLHKGVRGAHKKIDMLTMKEGKV